MSKGHTQPAASRRVRFDALRRHLRSTLALLRWEGVVLLAALGFGIVSAIATRWFLLFVALSAGFVYAAWHRALGETPVSLRFRQRARTLGFWVWGLLLILIGFAIFWRFSRWWSAVIFGVVYLAVTAWHLRWFHRREAESASIFRQAVALSVLPILLAWVVNSSIYQLYTLTVLRTSDTGSAATEWSSVRAQRSQRLASGGPRIAVALSGGGYRAAAIHAGVLSVLEQAGLPIAYLSTVSGGSIVGAAYAMGMPAADFRDQLKTAKPGLPNDLSNFYAVSAQLFLPRYGSGDTYARHFDRVYFHGRRLGDTGPPTLIINATRYRDGTRRAFAADRDGDLGLGRLVAASGAFPVAFDPVDIEGESYIDGGVVENLGIAGLQLFFAAHADEPQLVKELPDILIVSDAGLIPEAPPSWTKPSVLQMAVRAQQAAYFSMHRWIYSFYTDGNFDREGNGTLEQPFDVAAGRLWPGLPDALAARRVRVFVFSPSSPSERRRFAGYEAAIDAVADLDTLKELGPDEVDSAFWAGATIAAAYLPGLCAGASPGCRDVAVAAPPDR